MSCLISTEQLARTLRDEASSVRLVDASWHMPKDKRDARAEYDAEHIDAAVFFDIDTIADTESAYSHMLPSAELFSKKVGELGISRDDHLVMYDTQGMFSAARAWWMFRAFGHDASKLSVLNGGLLKWKAEGRAVQSAHAHPHHSRYLADFQPERVVDAGQVQEASAEQTSVILDARGAPRFYAEQLEPRKGVRAGHIPCSHNLPYRSVLDAPYQTLKPVDELQKVFGPFLAQKKPIITSCGSGVTACILALALYEIGYDSTQIYDGSWSEWGSRTDFPVAS